MNHIKTNSPKTSPEIRKINSLVQVFVLYCSFHSSLSVLCLLPMGLPCLERLLTNDLSSIFMVGDNWIIFRVPVTVQGVVKWINTWCQTKLLAKNMTADYSEGKPNRVMGVFVFIFDSSNIASSNSIVPSSFDDLSAYTINFIIWPVDLSRGTYDQKIIRCDTRLTLCPCLEPCSPSRITQL